MTTVKRAFFLLLALSVFGCSSDAADEPEPTLETPGSFVAQEEDSGEFRLLRMTLALKLDATQPLLLFRVYEPRVSSFDAARELAKERGIPIEAAADYAVEAEFVQTNYRVVWFRTMTEDEFQ